MSNNKLLTLIELSEKLGNPPDGRLFAVRPLEERVAMLCLNDQSQIGAGFVVGFSVHQIP
jgi:hypothetical protein